MSNNSDSNGDFPDEEFDWVEEIENEFYEGLVEDLETPEGVPTAARLEDGRLLVVGGPGTGTLTDSTDIAVQNSPIISDRDSALNGNRPILIMHRPYQNSSTAPRLLAEIQRAHAGKVAIAVSASLTQISQAAHQAWNNECAAAAIKIADPRSYLLDHNLLRLGKDPIKERSVRYAPYLASPDAGSWVGDVLDCQRQAGANLLLTSGRALDPTSPQQSLSQMCREGDDALAALQTGERLALNITVPASWLTQSDPRNALLDQLLDQEQFDIWHVRVQWPSAIRTWSQPLQEALVRGYKRLAELAEDEERTLLLPQTGLTGWFLLAFGASGFGFGLSGADNAFREASMGRGTRIERFYEKQLLHTVERTAQQQLQALPDYIACSCRYCRALHGREPWSHLLAAQHYALAIADLAAGATSRPQNRGGRLGQIRRSVRAAYSYADGKPLLETNIPQHLALWDQLL